jgi:hypothetical protein
MAFLFGRFVGGLNTFPHRFRAFGHLSASFQQESVSFAGGKAIADRVFPEDFAFLTRRCQTPVFWKAHFALEIPSLFHFRPTPTDHSDAFLPGFSVFHYGWGRP